MPTDPAPPNPAPPDPAGESKLQKALLEEYATVRQEVILHVQLYKTQERNGVILIPLAGLLTPLLVGRGGLPISALGMSATINLSPWIDLAILVAISTVAFFLVFSVLAVQFALQVLGVRSERLEEEINKCLGGQYFVWERLVPQIWSNKSTILYKMPDTFVPMLSSLLVVIFAVLLPLVAITKDLCKTPDSAFTVFVFLYVWYLFFALIFGACTTSYVTGPELRKDCRASFEYALIGGTAPLIRSGSDVIRNMGVATGAIALAFVLTVVWMDPRYPLICKYLEASPPTTAAAAPLLVPKQ
jgi:hypothetical protein